MHPNNVPSPLCSTFQVCLLHLRAKEIWSNRQSRNPETLPAWASLVIGLDGRRPQFTTKHCQLSIEVHSSLLQLVGSQARCYPTKDSISQPPFQLGLTTWLISSHGIQAEEIYGIFRPGLQTAHAHSPIFLFPMSWKTRDLRLNFDHVDKPNVLGDGGMVEMWEGRNLSSLNVFAE